LTDVVVPTSPLNPLSTSGEGTSQPSDSPAPFMERGPGSEVSEALALAASAERGSEHPLGAAIVRAAQAKGLALRRPEDFEAVMGRGVRAQIDGREVLVRSQALMVERGVRLNGLEREAERLQGEAKTAMWLAVDGDARAV